ncbi:MAG: carboxymuconolactone decarboxylase family protein [Verrucomicrobiae bacterium]
MNEKIQELIALGASAAAHCQPCLQHHLARSREIGLTGDEIRQAIEIGRMIERGAVSAFRQVEKQLLEPSGTEASGCCGSADCCG